MGVRCNHDTILLYIHPRQVDPDDERALAAFMAPGASSHRQTNLADLIMARLKERQTEQGLPAAGEG